MLTPPVPCVSRMTYIAESLPNTSPLTSINLAHEPKLQLCLNHHSRDLMLSCTLRRHACRAYTSKREKAKNILVCIIFFCTVPDLAAAIHSKSEVLFYFQTKGKYFKGITVTRNTQIQRRQKRLRASAMKKNP